MQPVLALEALLPSQRTVCYPVHPLDQLKLCSVCRCLQDMVAAIAPVMLSHSETTQ